MAEAAAGTGHVIRSLMLPIEGGKLVLPDTVVLQVMSYIEVEPLSDGPDWLLGVVTWRKRRIPLMSFELAAGRKFSGAQPTSRQLIIKSLTHAEQMPLYAIVLSAIPHPLRLSNENLAAMENAEPGSPLILNEVLVDGEPASIPNLDVIEEMLMQQIERIGASAQEEEEEDGEAAT